MWLTEHHQGARFCLTQISSWSRLNNPHIDSIRWGTRTKKGFCWEGASNAGITFFSPFRSTLVTLDLSHSHPTPDPCSALLCCSVPWDADSCRLHQPASPVYSWTPSVGGAKGRPGSKQRPGHFPPPSRFQRLISSSSFILPQSQLRLAAPPWWLQFSLGSCNSPSSPCFFTLLLQLKQCPTVTGLGVTHHV